MRHPWLQCQISDLFIDESGNKLNYSIFNYSSNRSWKFKSYGKTGFQKTLNEVREKGIVIKQLTTDRHMQIRKYLKEDEPQIDHQFDVWHFLKNTESKVIAAAKKFLVQLYKNELNPLLTTGGHARQVEAVSNFCEKNGWVFFFRFKINMLGWQVICSVNMNIQS